MKIDLDWDHEHEKQKDVMRTLIQDDYDLVVFRTGYGGGKTYLGCRWILETALQVPKSDNLILAVDRTKGKATTFQTFYDILPGDDVNPDKGGHPENSPVIADWNLSELRGTIAKTNSVIRLGGADRWDRYAGAEFNAIFCDEVANYKNIDLYRLWEMLVSRQRTKEGPNKTLWASTGRGYNQFYDITEKRVDKEGKPLQWADRMKVIVGSSRDNPYHSELGKLEAQFAGTEREKQAIEGGFSAPEGLVYNFSRDRHVVNSDNLDLRDTVFYAYDHGWNDPRVLLKFGETTKDQYIIVDEFYKRKSRVEEAVEWLEDQERGVIYCEHEPEHALDFQEIGFDTVMAKKDIDEGIEKVREFLSTDESGRVGLLVDRSCRNTIQEFLGYEEEDVGKNNARDHALDCVRYGIFTRESKAGHIPFATV